jgi:hypothetical protein
MFTLLFSAIFSIRLWFRSRAAPQVEILALRHQLPWQESATVLKRSQCGRFRLNSADRLLWGWALPPLVTMALLAADRKARSGDLLASKRVPLVLEVEESAGQTGKACDRWGGPGVDSQDEFGKSALGSAADPWGLLKLGIEVSQPTVAKYMVRQRKPPSQRGALS